MINNEMEKVLAKITNELNFPMFIKPANLGSSVGISKAKDIPSLKKALIEAAYYDTRIIIEEGKEIREIEVSVLGNEDPQASIPGEIIPCNEFYDYKAKYLDDRSELIIPAPWSPQRSTTLKLAIDAYLALGAGEWPGLISLFAKIREIFINSYIYLVLPK